MEILSSKNILTNLRDNRSRLTGNGYTLLDNNYDKGLLRLLSNYSISQLTKEKDLLIYPESFGHGDPSTHVIDYVEGEEDTPSNLYTSNMMGFIGRGQTDIFIHSRFGSHGNDYLLHYMLMRIGGLNVFKLSTSIENTKDKLHNLLLYLFPMRLNRAMAKGILKSYVHRSYNDSNLRGSIDIAKHIKKNKPTNGKIAYNVREFSTDNIITELIRHCIENLLHTAIGRMILRTDKTTMQNVDLIRQITPRYNPADVDRIVGKNLRTPIHPLYAEYRPLQQLCIAILQHRKVNYGKNREKIHGILFDGAWLWEEFIGKVIENIMDHRKRKDGKGNIYLFNKQDGHSFQQIIPDYLQLNQYRLVGDAKYMFLEGKSSLHDYQTESVYYKTIMYMYRFRSNAGYIFFPSEANSESKYQIKETEGNIYMEGLQISNAENFQDFCKEMNINEERLRNRVLSSFTDFNS